MSRADRLASDDLMWAYTSVSEIMFHGGDEAVSLLVELAEGAPDDHAVSIVGVGPIEDLLAQHAGEIADSLDAAARTHPRIRQAAVGVLR